MRDCCGIVGSAVFILPVHNVVREDATPSLDHAVMFPHQDMGLVRVIHGHGIIGSTSLLVLMSKATIDAVEGIPISTLLIAVADNVRNVAFPTCPTCETGAPFRSTVVLTNVMCFMVILVAVATTIAAGCITGCHGHWGTCCCLFGCLVANTVEKGDSLFL